MSKILYNTINYVWNCKVVMSEPMLTIAICDDNRTIAEQTKHLILEHFATTFSLPITVFNTGDELLEHYLQNKPRFDILIIDIEMPGLNGISTAKKIKRLTRTSL